MPLPEEDIRKLSRELVDDIVQSIKGGDFEKVLASVHDLTKKYLLNESEDEQQQVLTIVIDEANKIRSSNIMMPIIIGAKASSRLANFLMKPDEKLSALLSIGTSIWGTQSASELCQQLIDLDTKRNKLGM